MHDHYLRLLNDPERVLVFGLLVLKLEPAPFDTFGTEPSLFRTLSAPLFPVLKLPERCDVAGCFVSGPDEPCGLPTLPPTLGATLV